MRGTESFERFMESNSQFHIPRLNPKTTHIIIIIIATMPKKSLKQWLIKFICILVLFNIVSTPRKSGSSGISFCSSLFTFKNIYQQDDSKWQSFVTNLPSLSPLPCSAFHENLIVFLFSLILICGGFLSRLRNRKFFIVVKTRILNWNRQVRFQN